MKSLQGPIHINPSLQKYAWGDQKIIQELFGLPITGEPIAEAWFGDHPLASANVITDEGETRLDTYIQDQKETILGNELKQTHDTLPYLVKILAAKRPLSVQVHPNRMQAQVGFALEERECIPKDASNRSYHDPNHKPELLVALCPFYALAGFRPTKAIINELEHHPELRQLLSIEESGPRDLRDSLHRFFALADDVVEFYLGVLVRKLEKSLANQKFDPSRREHWFLRLHRHTSRYGSPDRGLVFVFILELLSLRPGQSIFIPAGMLHAYLEGAGVELMASSDNVLRAGLTTKHINITELLKLVRFDSRAAPILDPIATNDNHTSIYPIAAAEFQLDRVCLSPRQRISRKANGPHTVLVTSPGKNVRIHVGDQHLELQAGQASIIPHEQSYAIEADSPVELLVVGVPSSKEVYSSFRNRLPHTLQLTQAGFHGPAESFTDLETYINTVAFLNYLISSGDVVPGSRVAIASNLHPSTHNILCAVTRGIIDVGMEPIHCGYLPSPALSYYGIQNGCPSIMVTGNSLPFDHNEIHLMTSHDGLSVEELPGILASVAQVRRVEYRRIALQSLFDDEGYFHPRHVAPLAPAVTEAQALYIDRYLKAFPLDSLCGMRIGLYEHSAVGRDIIFDILKQLGAEVHPFGRSNSFTAIDSESMSSDFLTEIQEMTKELTERIGPLDAIVSTDVDGKYPLLLPQNPKQPTTFMFVSGDLLGMLVAHALEADVLAVPISSTDAIERHFTEKKVHVERTCIGSSFVINAMKSLPGHRRVGWETNGAFFTSSPLTTESGTLEPLPSPDAVLPLITALRTAQLAGHSVGELLQAFPPRCSRTGLLNEFVGEQGHILLEILAAPKSSLRQVHYREATVEAKTYSGEELPLNSLEIGKLYDLRTRLTAVFSPSRGFGKLSTLDYLDGLRITFDNGDIAHIFPSGNAPQLRIYAIADTIERAQAIVDEGIRDPNGILRELLQLSNGMNFVNDIKRNIANMETLFKTGSPASVLSIVSGSGSAQKFWAQRLTDIQGEFKARSTHAFHEDLPVNQAFGILLLWQRLRPKLQPNDSALIAFVFGDGTRSTPFTETECGQKPAMATFVRSSSPHRPFRSTVELALRTFAPVEAFIRRSGFEGIVIKWGDEIQIPTRDLSGQDPLFANADIVRFVSMQAMTEDTAKNKDWVAVDAGGTVRGFIPRRPLSAMQELAKRGILRKNGTQLVGGINLGSIAISRALLDILLETFEQEVNDPTADRKQRPDLDPQLFTALMVATIDHSEEREQTWIRERKESPALEELEHQFPDIISRLRGALDRFQQRHGRPVRIVAMDFGDQYWGDVGQHRSMYAFYMALVQDGPSGEVARSLAGLSETRDANGNILVGNTYLGEAVVAKNSIFIDAHIDEGNIEQSVLIGTRAGHLQARKAFDVQSTVKEMVLSPRSGTYKVVSRDPVHIELGGRATTIFLPDGEALYQITEDTPLKGSASAYSEPILENPMSFRDTHKIVSKADPETTEQQRTNKREEIEAILLKPVEHVRD